MLGWFKQLGKVPQTVPTIDTQNLSPHLTCPVTVREDITTTEGF